MPFPDGQRVMYGKAPLDRVVCQFRFPPILRIDSEVPADFQDRVRGSFPLLAERSEQPLLQLSVSTAVEPQPSQEVLKDAVQISGNKNYEFISVDDEWKINLTRNFVALTTQNYERWEGFKNRLDIPLEALVEVYNPNFFSRVGLRYVDVIKRSKLGLSDVSWDQLLQPYISGVLGDSKVANNLKSTESRYEIQLSDTTSLVRIITRFVESKDDGEICFMIDSDFFLTEKMSKSDAIDKLDYFHLRAARLFQWSITPLLHEAMEPTLL